MSNSTDPYELDDDDGLSDEFTQFDANNYVRRRDQPIVSGRRIEVDPAPPPNPNARPAQPTPPPVVGGAFDNFNPDTYLQRRGQERAGLVDPDQPVPLEGFDLQVGKGERHTGTYSQVARNRTTRNDYDIMRDGKPIARLGTIAFFLVFGFLVSACWISNVVLLVWYARR